MLFGVREPLCEEPPSSRAIARAASYGADVLSEEPAGVDSILLPRDALLCHGTLHAKSFVGDILSALYDQGNSSSS